MSRSIKSFDQPKWRQLRSGQHDSDRYVYRPENFKRRSMDEKMGDAKKVIITCAITGSTLSPSMSPYLPVTPDELVEQSVAGAEAGASIVHLHARMPDDGRPTND